MTTLESIENLLRQGRFREAREATKTLAAEGSRKIPRKDLAIFANRARRANLPLLAVRLLGPYVRSEEDRVVKRASPSEMSEYAIALHRIGASAEAAEILNLEKTKADRYSSLYRGLIFLSEWNYEAALGEFEKFSQQKGLNDYDECLALLNLAACRVFLHRDVFETEDTLANLSLRTERAGYNLLHANSQEVLAQHMLSIQDWPALRLLIADEKLAKVLGGSRYGLYMRKWRGIDLFEHGHSDDARVVFRELKTLALEVGSWELVRDADFYLARLEGNERLMTQLYFGTPYDGYRKFLRERWPEYAPPADFVWPDTESETRAIFCVSSLTVSGRLELRGPALRVGQLVHRTLSALLSELYRPVSTAALFSKVYGSEHFNPHSSPLKVRQAIFRLRSVFGESRLSVMADSAGYRILPDSRLGFRLSAGNEESKSGSDDFQLVHLRDTLGGKEFSAQELGDLMRASRATANRTIRRLADDGHVERLSNGPRTLYRFSPKSRAA